MKITPAEEQALRRWFKPLIEDVEKLLGESPIYGGPGLDTTALSGLGAVAQTASCLKEVALFVQYQASRDRRWTEAAFAMNLGKRLAEGGLIEQAVSRAVKTLDRQVEDNDQLHNEQLKVWLAVQYFGFLRRKFMYLKRVGDGGEA